MNCPVICVSKIDFGITLYQLRLYSFNIQKLHSSVLANRSSEQIEI